MTPGSLTSTYAEIDGPMARWRLVGQSRSSIIVMVEPTPTEYDPDLGHLVALAALLSRDEAWAIMDALNGTLLTSDPAWSHTDRRLIARSSRTPSSSTTSTQSGTSTGPRGRQVLGGSGQHHRRRTPRGGTRALSAWPLAGPRRWTPPMDGRQTQVRQRRHQSGHGGRVKQFKQGVGSLVEPGTPPPGAAGGYFR
jgi:hypothetical protein